MRSCESIKLISEGLIVKAIEAEINVRKRYISDVRVVNKKGKRERDLQGRGKIEDSMGAEGENGAVEKMKDRHHSLFSLSSPNEKNLRNKYFF